MRWTYLPLPLAPIGVPDRVYTAHIRHLCRDGAARLAAFCT